MSPVELPAQAKIHTGYRNKSWEGLGTIHPQFTQTQLNIHLLFGKRRYLKAELHVYIKGCVGR